MAETTTTAATRLVLLGAPGCGKGTQAKLLGESLLLPAISSGDILREAIAEATQLGQRVQELVTAGELVDDAIMAEVMQSRLNRADAERGFILDGYPRTVVQARNLKEFLSREGVELDTVLLIRVPREELLRRALLRGRSDDTETVVERRLEVYEEETKPLIGYYKEHGLLHPVNGDQSIRDVHSSILALLPVRA